MLGPPTKTPAQSMRRSDVGNHQLEGSHKGHLLHKENKKEGKF